MPHGIHHLLAPKSSSMWACVAQAKSSNFPRNSHSRFPGLSYFTKIRRARRFSGLCSSDESSGTYRHLSTPLDCTCTEPIRREIKKFCNFCKPGTLSHALHAAKSHLRRARRRFQSPALADGRGCNGFFELVPSAFENHLRCSAIMSAVHRSR